MAVRSEIVVGFPSDKYKMLSPKINKLRLRIWWCKIQAKNGTTFATSQGQNIQEMSSKNDFFPKRDSDLCLTPLSAVILEDIFHNKSQKMSLEVWQRHSSWDLNSSLLMHSVEEKGAKSRIFFLIEKGFVPFFGRELGKRHFNFEHLMQ